MLRALRQLIRVPSFRVALGGVVIAVATAAAAWNGLHGPLVFDDLFSIRDNASIRRLSHLGDVLRAPAAHGETVGGRPLLNLSLALNYAVGGLDVRGYHVVNIAIHVLSALVLFGLVRRTLAACRSASGAMAHGETTAGPPSSCAGIAPDIHVPAAVAIALWWALHPLQTESVTYLVQRAESLVGFFYLLTIYAVARLGACHAMGDINRVRRWSWIAVGACACGMATKEVMATAPLLALLYDRTFMAGSFRRAWRDRRRLYVGLACTWLLLGLLVLPNAHRGGSAGIGAGVAPFAYAVSQPAAILHYLRLAVWPDALTFDYGVFVARDAVAALPALALVGVLAAATVAALRVAPRLGFLGAWYFGILAPSSSIIPIPTQGMAEHRMYLALAAPVGLGVWWTLRAAGKHSAPALALLAIALGALTAARNRAYATPTMLWADTVAKRPDNARAHANLGVALADTGRFREAIVQHERALELQPDSAETENNLANALAADRQIDAAIVHFQSALRLRPDYVDAHYNYAKALTLAHRPADAVTEYEAALALRPDFVAAHNNLGRILSANGRTAEAQTHFLRALELEPNYVPAALNLGNLLVREHRAEDAIPWYRRVLAFQPDQALAHLGLAQALIDVGDDAAALAQSEQAARLLPNDPDAHELWAAALRRAGRTAESDAQLAMARRLRSLP
jgi:protein O-mannosyl-transferase